MNDSHSDLVLLIDVMARLHGRLRSSFASAREGSGLSDMEQTVLSAVTEAKSAPTVPQIGRSLGHPRQVIQRAATTLAEKGLIALTDNPGHKRAQLLMPTPAGQSVQAQANARAEAIAASLFHTVDPAEVRQANALLGSIRSAIERHEKETGE